MTVRVILLTAILSLVVLGVASADSAYLNPDWQSLPDSDPTIRLRVGCPKPDVVLGDPVLLEIELSNEGPAPFDMRMQDNGLPYEVTIQLSRPGESSEQLADQWTLRSGPTNIKRNQLQPGQSTRGTLLAWRAESESGLLFDKPGTVELRVLYAPAKDRKPIISDPVRILVHTPTTQQKSALDELRSIASDHYRYGPNEQVAELRVLLMRLLRGDEIELAEPGNDELVDRLAAWSQKYPSSGYAGVVCWTLGNTHLRVAKSVIAKQKLEAHAASVKQETEDLPLPAQAKTQLATAEQYLRAAAAHAQCPPAEAQMRLCETYLYMKNWGQAQTSAEALRRMPYDARATSWADQTARKAGRRSP